MDKNQLINVLHHFHESSVEEAQGVLELKESFPYSQLLHALAARMTKDHGFSNQQHELQLAAVYSSDRAVLKEVMTGALTWEVSEQPVQVLPETTVETTGSSSAALIEEPVIKKVVSTPETSHATAEVEAGMDVADKVIHDLDRLHALKHNFEMMFVDTQPAEAGVDAPPVQNMPEPLNEEKPTIEEEPLSVVSSSENTPTEQTATQQTETTETEIPKVKESLKTRRARIIELAKALAAQEENQVSDDAEQPHSKKKNHPGETLIDEIKESNQELEPSGKKQQEQLRIIEEFIKTQPSIANTKEKIASAPVGDLSSIKSGEFNDNVVSETLAELLIQQGKKDRAIEVLKKLIWKFPQKKAYFAAQIDELKK